MFQRGESGTTLKDLIELEDVSTTTTVALSQDISTDLLAVDPKIKVRTPDNRSIEIPATEQSLDFLAAWTKIPDQFFNRLNSNLQQTLLNSLLTGKGTDELAISWNDESGVIDAYKPTLLRIPKVAVIETACNTLGLDAKVIDFRNETSGYSFDVAASEHIVGGDLLVGDITWGGLRFGQDQKHGLRPTVQQWLYRLVCTNGMEVPDHDLSLRGVKADTVEAVIEEYEALARDAAGDLYEAIEHFYSLRSERLDNPERTLVRVAQEQRINDNVIAQILQGFPEYLDADGGATMFDVVNAITNQANNPDRAEKPVARRQLERLGGAVFLDFHSQVARCPSCQSKVI